MKTLTLPLHRKWFDMIKSGEKKEEYREQSKYWIKRLLTCSEKFLDALWDIASVYPNSTEILNRDLKNCWRIKHFDRLVITLGYPKADDTERRLVFKNPKIRIGTGRPEWGAEPGKNYFVITWEEKNELVWARENYEKLEFELREAKNDAWAANLVLADARCDLRKQLIKRCRQNQEYCYLRFLNEGRTRTLFWLKWQDRWIELEKFYKESETED